MAKLGYSTFYVPTSKKIEDVPHHYQIGPLQLHSPLFQIRNTCTCKHVQLIWYIFINVVMETNEMNERTYCFREEFKKKYPTTIQQMQDCLGTGQGGHLVYCNLSFYVQ